jgi:hypothetical protein
MSEREVRLPPAPRPKAKAERADEWPYISRKRALRLALPNFFDPDDLGPCGHVSQRRAITGLCLRCASLYQQGVAPLPHKVAKTRERGGHIDSTYQGKDCKRGHGGLRYSANSVCVECHRDAQARSAARVEARTAANRERAEEVASHE